MIHEATLVQSRPTRQRAWLLEAGTAVAGSFGRLPPTALMLLSLLSVQLGSALATKLFSSLGPVGTTLASIGFATLVLTVAFRPRLDRRLAAHRTLVLVFGVTIVGMELPFFLSLQYIPLGIAATITFLGPLGLAAFTSRRLTHFLWIGVAALGVGLLTPEIGGSLDPRGVALAVLSAVAWAGFAPISKRAGRDFGGLAGLIFGMWAATILLVPLALAEGTLVNATLLGLAGAFAVGALTSLLPMAMEFQALQRLSARSYGILLTLEPAIAMLVGAVFLSQMIGLTESIAVGCVVLAAIGITLSDRQDGQSS